MIGKVRSTNEILYIVSGAYSQVGEKILKHMRCLGNTEPSWYHHGKRKPGKEEISGDTSSGIRHSGEMILT